MSSERFAQLVEEHPGNELFRFSLGQALYNEGRYGECIEPLRFCTEKRGDWMIPRILLGKALIETGSAGEARPVLADALQLAIDQHHEDPEAELRSLLDGLQAPGDDRG